MIDETTSIIGLKFILFAAVFLQLADVGTASSIFDYLDTFGTVAILIFGIRYFIAELKARDVKHAKIVNEMKADYMERWKEQENRHNSIIEAKDETTKELLNTQRQIFLDTPDPQK